MYRNNNTNKVSNGSISESLNSDEAVIMDMIKTNPEISQKEMITGKFIEFSSKFVLLWKIFLHGIIYSKWRSIELFRKWKMKECNSAKYNENA